MKHHIERTSPKGPGAEFIGTCRLCGRSGLTVEDANKECENIRELTEGQAITETIRGLK